MRATRPRDTSPELLLRSALHRLGLRYRVHRRPEPDVRTTPDLVFASARTVVYVDGCFWHSCPEHGTMPRRNGVWWRDKLAATVDRDRRTEAELAARGWHVIRVWEHEQPDEAAARIADALSRPRDASRRLPQ